MFLLLANYLFLVLSYYIFPPLSDYLFLLLLGSLCVFLADLFLLLAYCLFLFLADYLFLLLTDYLFLSFVDYLFLLLAKHFFLSAGCTYFCMLLMVSFGSWLIICFSISWPVISFCLLHILQSMQPMVDFLCCLLVDVPFPLASWLSLISNSLLSFSAWWLTFLNSRGI